MTLGFHNLLNLPLFPQLVHINAKILFFVCVVFQQPAVFFLFKEWMFESRSVILKIGQKHKEIFMWMDPFGVSAFLTQQHLPNIIMINTDYIYWTYMK